MKSLSTLRSLIAGTFLAVAGLLSPLPAAAQSAYEAPLPADINTNPDLCASLPCQEVLPGADSFSERMGKPSYVEAYRTDNGDKQLVGYVFLSTDIVDIPAYSGKPVITLIGMDTQGIITGTKILRHSEPILLLGIPESVLTKFVNQYLGKYVGDKIEIGKGRDEEGYIGLDAITGATVTVIAQNQVVMRSGVAIARQVGILKIEPKPAIRFSALDEKLGWDQLVKEGSVQRLTVKPEQLGMPRDDQPYVDMYFGYLNTPSVGKSVLGDGGYRNLMSRLGPDDHAIFIVSNGSDTFKGSGFVRGGIFDRVQVAQDMDAYTFRDLDYLNLWGLEAAGAPSYKESAIFIIRGQGFSAAYPWKLVFLANKLDRETGHRDFVSFDREYWVLDKYQEAGRPTVVKPDAPWVRVWKMRAVEIGLFTALLVAVAVVYASRDALTRRSTRKNKWPVNAFKYAFWVISIGFVGFGLLAQPSITQVLTWFHSLLFKWQWELFLTDPFIFLFWIFIILTTFVWGRGLFCGWMCPFGSLSELIYKVAGAIGLKRFQFALPMKWHNRLKWIKYGVFFALLAVSVFSMGLAEKLAEVEPFKTTFLVGMFNRAWPYTLFVAVLLGLSIFIERPFCKYLCPLGASLAMPSTFRWFGLKRKQECNSCKACAVGCGSLAIDEHGRIDHRECMHCLDCMILYTDEHACPPLAQERKRRTKAGLALTPIGSDGYYIPIKPVPATKA
ncbi:Nitrous oxide reductase maturation protein NosR [Thauera humireducens]|uniref:NosR/NirI family protein n=1 Tax=Thauera TaxID=33057 RepID=UPI0002CFDE9B|nr:MULTISPECIES: NosR/NirI family protein [Thauera]ENO75847.1 nitrous oxide expression regulator, NosR [Thauera sp. 63]CAH1746996.1 Nitrous oxide reductase maturation protein NosR [Thauera humireducens]